MRPARLATVAYAAAFALAAHSATAAVVSVRTLRISIPAEAPQQADGPSTNPFITADGGVVVFETAATNFVSYDLNGSVRDVVAWSARDGRYTIVSSGSDGDSTSPVASADGGRVAFVSEASTFAAADVNRTADIYVRDAGGPVRLVSVPARGGAADGPSWEPDMSADGRRVVFTSAATNLVAGDTNGRPDVFLRDLTRGRTTRVSVTGAGAQGNGASRAPAISADGRVVSFSSAASNLVPGDTNGIGDVFVRDVAARRTQRVSLSSTGRQQDKAVAAPFAQVSDVSRGGRYVVFDSDAMNLTTRDRNRRTDVFRRDRRTGRTTLISASSIGRQGNNDSVTPSITPDGRFVAFQSFAGNLAPGNAPGADIFVRDLRTRTTTIANVPATAALRARELVPQLLQRPTLSADGTRVAFTSTAANLVAGDDNGAEDVFLRLLDPPRGWVRSAPAPGSRPTLSLAADDPRATHFVCRIDDRPRAFMCPMGTTRLPRLRRGRHVVRIRAGGPGMLYDPSVLKVPIEVTGADR